MQAAIRHAVAILSTMSAWSATAGIVFEDVTSAAGISFRHVNGASGEKYYVETMGSGACWFDADEDGDIDLYAVNSGELPGFKGQEDPRNRLYRNDGNGRFTDITDQAGVGGRGYGMGCVAGDLDNDGDTDLYVTNFGPNVMYRNEGGGRFVDVTAQSGTGDPRWSASAALADTDRDGDLDLYVTNYIDFTLQDNKFCGNANIGYRAYCHPDMYNGVPDTLYRNEGDWRFVDVGPAAGVSDPGGKGLGVVFTDIDDDGWPDIYVANDKTINFVYHNRRDGTFRDISLESGAGFSEAGMVQAGMGTDAADVNGDGRMDLIVTNLDHETNELYLNNGDLTFTNATFGSGLGALNFLDVGFGADFLDYDNDGFKDVLVVNGHIIDNIRMVQDEVSYEQPRSMLENDGKGRFREVGESLGLAFVRPNVGRGLAVGDMDDDGDLDLFVVNSNREAELLRNDGGNTIASGGGNWILVDLTGTASNRDAIGARVRVKTLHGDSESWQVDEMRAGSSYLSQNDRRLSFGLGDRTSASLVEIRWPSGAVQSLRDVPANRILTVSEPLF